VIVTNDDWLTYTVDERGSTPVGDSVTNFLIDLIVFFVGESSVSESVVRELYDLVLSDSHFVSPFRVVGDNYTYKILRGSF
jgi:hypothetical protein